MLSNEKVLEIAEEAKDIEATLGNKDPIRLSETIMVEAAMMNPLLLAPQYRTSIPSPARMYFRLDVLREGSISAVKQEVQRIVKLWSEGQVALDL